MVCIIVSAGLNHTDPIRSGAMWIEAQGEWLILVNSGPIMLKQSKQD